VPYPGESRPAGYGDAPGGYPQHAAGWRGSDQDYPVRDAAPSQDWRDDPLNIPYPPSAQPPAAEFGQPGQDWRHEDVPRAERPSWDAPGYEFPNAPAAGDLRPRGIGDGPDGGTRPDSGRVPPPWELPDLRPPEPEEHHAEFGRTPEHTGPRLRFPDLPAWDARGTNGYHGTNGNGNGNGYNENGHRRDR
jgi:hypothetical protein